MAQMAVKPSHTKILSDKLFSLNFLTSRNGDTFLSCVQTFITKMSGNPNIQPVKKRKKHAPDRQQPEWLFPKDEENPALKPHVELTLKEKLEKQRSIDFLTRRAVGAPMKPAPPVQLLNLIGAFLAEYGFTSTGRIFSTERQGRSKLDGWKDETGGKLEKGMSTLGKIYKEWRKEWDERRLLDMTSSDEEDDAATKREKMLARREKVEKQKNRANDDATSSSGSSSSEDSNAEMDDAPPAKRTTKKPSSASSSSTSSDSDADDEKEVPAAKSATQKSKPNKMKRKASSSSSSASESSSTSEDEAPKSKKAKTSAESSSSESASESDSSSNKGVQGQGSISKLATKKAEQSSSEASSDSSSGSEAESLKNTPAKNVPLPTSSESDSSSDSESDSASDTDTKNKPPVSSDTSATLSDGPKKVSPANSETDSSSSDSAAGAKDKDVKTKGKGKGSKGSPSTPAAQVPRKTNVPFSRIPKDIKVDPKLASNAYVPYDYAQKAHEDLVVTKGKNFTKEKNKKKRGSYKGGYIDVEGKKGIKFED